MIVASKSESSIGPKGDALALGFATRSEFSAAAWPAALALSPGNERAFIAGLLLPSLGIRPADLAVAFQLADAVAEQRAKFHRMFAGCQRDFCEASVHEARVHCRRLIARLTLVQECVPGCGADAMLRPLKGFLKRLGELRDVQVQKKALTCELTQHPELAGLWIELGRRELDLTKSAAQVMGRFKIAKLSRRLEKLEADLTDPTAHLVDKASLHQRVVQVLASAYAKVRKRRRAINLARPSTLHRTRTVFKKFRYMVESLPPSVAQPSRPLLSAMAEYQSALGKIQDIEVLQGFVEDYAQRFPMVAAELAGFQELLRARCRTRVDEYLGVADSFESFWPPPPDYV